MIPPVPGRARGMTVGPGASRVRVGTGLAGGGHDRIECQGISPWLRPVAPPGLSEQILRPKEDVASSRPFYWLSSRHRAGPVPDGGGQSSAPLPRGEDEGKGRTGQRFHSHGRNEREEGGAGIGLVLCLPS